MSARPVSAREYLRRRAGVIAGRARGWKTRRIAAELGLPHGTLRSWIERDARDLMPGSGTARLDTTGWERRIRALRADGLSWQEVAAELGTCRSVLTQWRHNHPDFDPDTPPAP